ncbi:unnamed protein product [Peronospora farinosa]|uniref:Origin recognition complex subunit 3 winged helix C-terminal domain-containing protein n=1 Tax=Peronospora farinosa TaxID=134698 RepID=A0ABN8BZ24_9STRA|nr:unnamed protein product [Peronospora farinosa]
MESGTPVAQISTTSLLSSRRGRDYNAPVLFPEFHAIPTAAIITGTDATSSNLWVGPLMQKLRRTFPLCLVVPRDVTSARRFIEWLTARLEKLCAVKHKEEHWLEELVENFDLLPLDMPPVAVENSGRRLTRHERVKTAGVAGGLIDGNVQDEKNKQMDDICYDSISESEDSGDDDTDFGSSRRGKSKRRRLAPAAYGRWTISKLLSTIERDIDELVSPTCGNTCCEWVAMLGELVHDRLQEALTWVKKLQKKDEESVSRSIACFDEAVDWLQHKIVTAQDTAPKLLNAAPDSNNPTTSYIGITEMALAIMLQRVYLQYVSFLEECTIDRIAVNDRRRIVKQKMCKHENYYSLESDGKSQIPTSPQTSCTSQPFLLLCIEQLESFSQQVFGDFLEIWIHFVRQQQETHHAGEKYSGMLGFVIGVASATSPALRRLDLAVTNRLELQFFSLVDSRKCFDDILESLVVKARLPLSFSGEVVRAIARRHHRVPSVPRLLHALRFLLFTHFRRCPWSFLALAVDDLPSSGESPVLVASDVASLPYRVSSWIKRHRRNLTREAQGKPTGCSSALTLWLASCSAFELRDLESRVMSSSSGVMAADDNWITVLETAMLHERRRRARWRMGWDCFRSTCSWLDVRIDGSNEAKHDEQEDLAVTHLALALEGRLGKAPRFMEVLRRLQFCRWALVSGMIEDWRASFRVFGSSEDDGEDLETSLCELAMLCAYARTEETPPKMETALRNELVTVFTDRLVSALLHPVPCSVSPADALVTNWTLLTTVNVLEARLCFKYYDNLQKVLQDAGIGEDNDTAIQVSWVHDVGLAFLFYQESAGARLSLCEWYESFALELNEEAKTVKKNKKNKDKKNNAMMDSAIKSRFVRALCTLRHWGFIKSDAPCNQEQDLIEKLVFI